MSDQLAKSSMRVDLRNREAEITPKQEKVLFALLTSPTMEDAALEADVDRRTIYRYLKDPVFETAYRAERSRLLEATLSRLHYIAGQALDTLARNLDCGIPSVEVRAAQAILGRAIESEESYALADFVAEIHQYLEKDKS